MLVSSTAAVPAGTEHGRVLRHEGVRAQPGRGDRARAARHGRHGHDVVSGRDAPGFAAASGAESLPLFTSTLVPKMSSARVARAGYDAMMRGKPVLVTGIVNKLVAFSGRVFPRAIVFPVARLLLGDHS